MRRLILLALAGAALPGAAFAHAFLDHAVPAVGSSVNTAPPQVLLVFTQPLEPAFSGATIAGPGGQPIAATATIDPRNRTQIVLTLSPLPPGHYKVSWHVLSVDTHRTEGSFGFDIVP
jgi:hypothetical protein